MKRRTSTWRSTMPSGLPENRTAVGPVLRRLMPTCSGPRWLVILTGASATYRYLGQPVELLDVVRVISSARPRLHPASAVRSACASS